MTKKVLLSLFSLFAVAGTFIIITHNVCKGKKMTLPSQPLRICMETSEGTMEFELMPSIAPKACENMVELSKKGYYDGTIFHRIIPEFMVQGGDPTGTGRGGKSIWGKPFADECVAQVTFNQPGLLAMANAGPNSNGSQFFITTVETPWLDGNHTIFGKLVKGVDTLKKIEALGSSSGTPLRKVTLYKLYVKELSQHSFGRIIDESQTHIFLSPYRLLRAGGTERSWGKKRFFHVYRIRILEE